MSHAREGWSVKLARWMSRRNGRSLAQYMAVKIEAAKDDSPQRSLMECWGEVLRQRPGWREVASDRYEFRTGERLEFRKELPIPELLSRMTEMEVKPLGKGLPEEVRKILIEEARQAAITWWEKQI